MAKQVRFYICPEADEAIKMLKEKHDVTANEAVNLALIDAKRALEEHNGNNTK